MHRGHVNLFICLFLNIFIQTIALLISISLEEMSLFYLQISLW